MTFANPLPIPLLAACLVAAALFAWLAYSGRQLARGPRIALTALRFLVFALLVLFLLRPVSTRTPVTGPHAIVAVLVDSSRSMGIEDADGRRRIDAARELLTRELLPALSGEFGTEVLAFGDRVSPTSPEALAASARQSDITGALAAVAERYRGKPVAGVVLLSDGADTGPAAERAGPPLASRVFPIGIGGPARLADREVLGVTAAEAVLDGSRVDVTVSVVSHGFATDPVDLRLLENGRLIDVRRVRPSGDGTPVVEQFAVHPAAGVATLYTVEIPGAVGELVPENNSRSVLVQPPPRPRRVLLVQGAPGYEGSFLRRALSGDTGLHVDTVVRKGRNEEGEDTYYIQAAAVRAQSLVNGFPAKPADLFAYDAVVLANVDLSTLVGAQSGLAKAFVGRRGGGLLVVGAQSFTRAGPAGTALDEVLPLDLSERLRDVVPAGIGAAGTNRVALTEAGERHPIMQLAAQLEESKRRWEKVPALADVAAAGTGRPGASILAVSTAAGGTRRPLVAVQRYGEGRSLVFAGEASWRWRMMLPAADRSYDTFWRQAVRWLATPAADPISLTLPTGAAVGEAIAVRVRARDAAFEPMPGASVDVRVTHPDGRVVRVPAAKVADSSDEFSARFQANGPGVHRVTAEVQSGSGAPTTASASMLVGGVDREMTDPSPNARVLRGLAEATGGEVLQPGGLGGLAARLREGAGAVRQPVQQDAWHSAWSFAAIVLLLSTEWLLRRRYGLR